MDTGGTESFSAIVHGNPLWQAFVTPFTDIVDTGMYALKRIGTVTTKELGSLVQQAAVALIPIYGMDAMNEIEANAKASIQKSVENLDKQYQDVINRNLDALMNQSDVWGLAFLFNPGLILSSKLAVTAPQVLAGTIGYILGGKVKDRQQAREAQEALANCQQSGEDCRHYEQQVKQLSLSLADQLVTFADDLQKLENDPATFFFSQRKTGGGQQHSNFDFNLVHSQGGSYDMYGDVDALYEQQQQMQQQISPQMIKQAKDSIIAAIKKIFTNPQLKQQLSNSNFGKQLKAAGTSAVTGGVQKTFGSIKTYKQMQQKYANNPQFKKIDDELTASLKKQNLNDQQIAQEKEKLVPQMKKQFKSMLIKQMQNTKMDPQSLQNIQKVIQSIN